MSGLETTYYIIAIIVMSLALLLLIALVVAVVVIRNKIVAIEKTVQEKLSFVTNTANRAAEIVDAAKDVARAVKGK